MLDIVKRGMDERYVMTGETGSYRYMAPEVFRHEQYSEKVDIYSLACVMFFLFMGEPPLANIPPEHAARAAAVMHSRSAIRPSIDKRIADVIERCWHPVPAERPTAAQVCDILEVVLEGMGDSGYFPAKALPSCCSLT